MDELRINRFLAQCGVPSRRVAEELILEGRVSINGNIVDNLAVKVASEDLVKVDNKVMRPRVEMTILLQKPRGFICSTETQGGLPTIYSLLPPSLSHLKYVGRLDADTEGLLILTNDGEFSQQISHPTNVVEKEYVVTLDQSFENRALDQLLRGVKIPEGLAKARYVRRVSARRAKITLVQGLKRQVRQMFQCVGLRVQKLVRVRIGMLQAPELEPGKWRTLEADDIKLLLQNPAPPKDFSAAFKPAKFKPGRPEPETTQPQSRTHSRDRRDQDRPPRREARFTRPERAERSERFSTNQESGEERKPAGIQRFSTKDPRPSQSFKSEFFGPSPRREREEGSAGEGRARGDFSRSHAKDDWRKGPERGAQSSDHRSDFRQNHGDSRQGFRGEERPRRFDSKPSFGERRDFEKRGTRDFSPNRARESRDREGRGLGDSGGTRGKFQGEDGPRRFQKEFEPRRQSFGKSEGGSPRNFGKGDSRRPSSAGGKFSRKNGPGTTFRSREGFRSSGPSSRNNGPRR